MVERLSALGSVDERLDFAKNRDALPYGTLVGRMAGARGLRLSNKDFIFLVIVFVLLAN